MAFSPGEMCQLPVLFPLVSQAGNFAAQTLDSSGLEQQKTSGGDGDFALQPYNMRNNYPNKTKKLGECWVARLIVVPEF